MGQVLPTPVTAKESSDGGAAGKGLVWGSSCMQGWRATMEDAHFSIANLEGDWTDTAAFGVMDGHGGDQVAHFCEQYLPAEIAKGSAQDPCGSLVRAFEYMDELLMAAASREELSSYGAGSGGSFLGGKTWASANPDWIGCTACVCLVRPSVLVVANAGDSRTVLCRRGQAVPLSEDHKPNLPAERERIQRAGGSVERQQVGRIVQYRVCGNLNLSRSIGDLEYKKCPMLPANEQMICSTPEVQTFPREAGDEFLIIACDGVWDVLGSQDAVDFVRERLMRSKQPLSVIAEDLLDHCVSPDLSLTNGLGGDNMTVIIVAFLGSDGEPATVAGRGLQAFDLAAPVEEGAVVPAGFCSCEPLGHRAALH